MKERKEMEKGRGEETRAKRTQEKELGPQMG